MTYLIINESLRPPFNLALEEYVLTDMDIDAIILWRNSKAVIVGGNQNTAGEIDADYVKANGIAVVRRLSGGGAVFHDPGNVNFTFIHKLGGGDFSNYEKFTDPIVGYLAELGVYAELQGRNDLVIDGLKFCGNAQAVRKDRIMHHGCILYSADFGHMARALKPREAKMESKGIKSVRKRVTNIADHMASPMPVEDFFSGLANYFMLHAPGIKPYELLQSDIAAAEKISREKYETWEWNFGHSPRYNIEYERRYAFGTVGAKVFAEQGVISGIHIFGDFFGMLDKSGLESAVIGTRHDRDAVKNALEGLNIGDYILGMTSEQFAELIC
ncbi:MAG: lipoate--protein ligase [Synergistaceae bacterium]|jgi:lipoate-protein ligase A|nr:lipoate--protein ligase [Synergistaceae bacterium]